MNTSYYWIFFPEWTTIHIESQFVCFCNVSVLHEVLHKVISDMFVLIKRCQLEQTNRKFIVLNDDLTWPEKSSNTVLHFYL